MSEVYMELRRACAVAEAEAIEARIGVALSPAMKQRLLQPHGTADLLEELGIDRLDVPQRLVTGGYTVERTGMLFGYTVEKAEDGSGHVGYYLHGPKVTYRLMRRVNQTHSMFVLNSRGNIANIKGNYNFSDKGGRLVAVR